MRYTKALLYTYNLLQLRTIAREMGVKSPTTKKINQLIDSIMDIQEGKLQPDKSIKRGRKPKGCLIKIEDTKPYEVHNEFINKLTEIYNEYTTKMNNLLNEYYHKIN